MDIVQLLSEIPKNPAKLVFTGICDPNRVQAVYNALLPSEASAVGTLVQRQNPMPDHMAYRFEVRAEEAAKDDYTDDSIDVLYIGNNSIAKSGQALIDAWLPKIKPGGYLICFDQYADSGDDFVAVDDTTTDYPPNWYRQKWT